ncbi:hypothetical protein [Chromobacterium sp. IIBBL 290-4]|uniref:hypothetical protein n=1 Tax=Chromobacterium sp. IIBBL 290-4 TaxID=2953890 RepID=UPI0020B8E057|nr:hypothetical protein [Chromobacterium sp. IIBBL 290-4]UTH73202.1 hypothetical protein NKT35_16920 [Chromobacterium sp. IIBBL 290-4]
MKGNVIKMFALCAALVGQAPFALAMPVTNSYIQSSAKEIRGLLGGYSQPTVYVNQNACGEPQSSAMACGPRTISVGTGFLQQQESSYGNYVAKFILAHEWGHTVQFTYNINLQPPMQELQADCVGGTFAKYAETNLRYPSFIENAVASARDAADYQEHGTPSQRDYYSRYGYANGFDNCMNSI